MSRARQQWWPALLIAVLCAIAFHNAFPREFVLDSAPLVRDNVRLSPATSWGSLLLSNYWGDFSSDGLWRPLTLTSFRFERNALGFGADPRGYVTVNLLLHVVTCLLLWRLALHLQCNAWTALAAAALFACHPIATEIVPNIVGRADLLVAVSLLGALLAWTRYLADRRRLWLVATVVLWLIGLFSKEHAIVLLVLLGLTDLLTQEGTWRERSLAAVRSHWTAYGILLVIAAGWLLLRREVLAPSGEGFVAALNNPLVLETAGARRLTAVALTGEYVTQALWPLQLCADYSAQSIHIVRAWGDGTLWWGIVSTLSLLALAAWAVPQRRRPAVTIGAIFFLVALLPTTNFVFAVGAVRADRFLYVPLLGLALVVASLGDAVLAWLTRSGSARLTAGAWLVALVPSVAALTARTIARNPDWHTARALWRHTVAVAPENAKARHNLALELLQSPSQPTEAQLAEVAAHLEKSIEVARTLPGDEFFEPYINLGQVYLARSALLLREGRPPDEARAWVERAVATLREGEERMQFAGRRRASWEAALARKVAAGRTLGGVRPVFGDVKLHLAFATALDAAGRPVEAGEQLRKAIAVAPLDPSGYVRLALLYARAGSVRDVEILLGILTRLPPPTAEDALILARVRAFEEQQRSRAGTAAPASPAFSPTISRSD